jgi:predicted PurR-regulated permease PerM
MIEFTQEQRKIIASGLTVLALALVFSFVAVLVYFLFKALAFASVAIMPVVIGFFLSLFFKPYYSWWKRILKNSTLALVMLLSTVFVPLFILIWNVGAVLVDQISSFISQGPAILENMIKLFKSTFPKLNVLLTQINGSEISVSQLIEKYGSTALEAGTGALKGVGGVLSLFVSLIFFIFFLMTKERKGSDVVSQFLFLKEDTRSFLAEQIDAFFDILVSFFQRQMIICLIEGLLYGFGFQIVGLQYGFLLGFVLGVLNLIPFFGSVVCLPVALTLSFFGDDGSLFRLFMVLLVWLSGQFLDGYFITPRIQGNKTGIGYAGVIFSFFFWGVVLGPLVGMLLAIPLSAFCVVLWRSLKSKYIKPIV